MSHECEYCKETLSTSRALKEHQQSALYCLEIQKLKGRSIKSSIHKCKCGSILTTKSNLTRHEKTCQSIISAIGNHASVISNSTINSHNTTNITNNITITPAKPFTIQDLTKPYILERLTPVITKEIVKSGMGAITELVVEVLLQKDGKYCYYCSDKSRKKFTMLIDCDGQVIERSDPNAQALRSILSIPLSHIVGVLAEKYLFTALKDTHDEVKKLKQDGAGFSSSLAASLPCDSDGMPEVIKDMIEENNRDLEGLRLNEEIDARITSKTLRKKMIEESPYLA